MKTTTLPLKKSINRSPLRLSFILITLLLACFALSPVAHAVVPAPDGAYPNFTTAEGQNSLQSLTTGAANTALGAYSLFSTSTASFNTAVGAGALDLNTADSNTAVGTAALLLNTTGTENTAIGTAALEFNDTGSQNVAIGDGVMFNNIVGSFNVAMGDSALNNADSAFNTAVGFSAGQNLAAGGENIYLGDSAGTLDFTGASPGDETGVIRIGSVFSGAAACFINGIATNSQVWNGVTVCQVTVNGFGQLGVDCVNPNNPGATPASPQRQVMLNDKVEKLQATVAQLTQQLKEQAAQIQKVSAELEVRKSSPQIVLNNQ